MMSRRESLIGVAIAASRSRSAPQPVVQKLPKGNAGLAARFLEAQKRVPAATTQVTPRAAADFPQAGILANVGFRQVVVQRQMRMLQHCQQAFPLGMEQREG